MRKKYYEINIAYRGAVDTITPLTKKEKNAWLINYFTQGDGRSWATQRYHAYLDSLGIEQKKKITFEKFRTKVLKKIVK